MSGAELMRLFRERRFAALLLLLLLGLGLVALSFFLPEKAEEEAPAPTLETRLAAALSDIAGAGQVSVFINEDEEGVRGVLVVAEGAGDLAVQTELMRAAMTALDVPAASVEVFARAPAQEGGNGA